MRFKWGHEDWAPVEESVSLWGTSGLSLSLPFEDIVRNWPSVSQEVKPHKIQSYWHQDFGLSASRKMKKQISIVKLPNQWYFVMAASDKPLSKSKTENTETQIRELSERKKTDRKWELKWYISAYLVKKERWEILRLGFSSRENVKPGKSLWYVWKITKSNS